MEEFWGRVSQDDLQSSLIRSTRRATNFASSKGACPPPPSSLYLLTNPRSPTLYPSIPSPQFLPGHHTLPGHCRLSRPSLNRRLASLRIHR